MRTNDYTQLARALFELTEGKKPEEQAKAVKDFAAYLAENRQLGFYGKIAAEYAKLYNEHHGIVEADVTLTARLPEATKVTLREAIKKRHGAKEVRLNERVDQRILGGMKIRIGDTVYDSTLQNSLDQLQAALLK